MKSNFTVLHIILYKAEFFSNFMKSILYLGKEIKNKGSRMIICVPEQKVWTKLFEKENINVELLPINNIFDFNAVKLLKNLIKKYKPDIIHSHFGLESYVIPCLCKILTPSIKIIWQWRNPPHTDIIINQFHQLKSDKIKYLFAKYKRWIGNFFYKILDNLISIHIVVSNEIKNILIKRKITKKEKIKLIFNAIEEIKTTNEPHKSLSEQSIVIGNISNFREQKDHITFIKAAKLVIDKLRTQSHGFGTKFILAGDGPTKTAAIDYAKKIGILDNLIFTGIENNISKIIDKCSFTVLASFYEGLPNAILESLALEKPVIATNVGGVPDIIKDGYNGFLVPIKNHTAMAEKMLYLIENKEEIKRMGKNGRKTIEEKFSIKEWAKKIITIYDEILKN